jgi:hypothetical protein
MATLKDDWFYEGLIDFEYKKYILLAYLQEVEKSFYYSKLYPHLGELVNQYQNLQKFLNQKKKMFNDFPDEIENFDLNSFRINYRKVMADDDLMSELQAIVEYSLENIQQYLQDGRDIYEFIEKQIVFDSIGIVPLECHTGFMMLKNGQDKIARVYKYNVSIFENSGERYRSIKTQFLTSYELNFTYPYWRIKEDILMRYNWTETPAAYAFETPLTLPVEETLLPITKRMLAVHLARK